jgi:hypothetical protein
MKKTTQTLLLFFSTFLLLVSVTGSAQDRRRGNAPDLGSTQDRLRGNSSGFTGTWKTVTGKGKQIVITLEQDRHNMVTGYYGINGLTGSYKPLEGSMNGLVKVSWRVEPVLQSASSITGKVTGNVLRFTWSQDDRRHGAGRFTLSSDGETFEGTFSMTDNPDNTSGGTWNGTRQHSFAGAWQGKFGDGAVQLILQQSGAQVTGQVKINSAEMGELRGGSVVGKTLRFQLFRPGRPLGNGRYLPDEHVGAGELVMDIGGRSFKGTILGAAVSGTLLGR